ncbi:MAG: cytochrome C [Bacteroidetes bacterium]|nr:cytochrome C [Bacteroidota bacterium]
MPTERNIRVFVDDDPVPFGEFKPPVRFLFDTTKLPDGPHTLRVVARSTSGVEGVRTIPFEVRNGPSITVLGLKPGEVVDDRVPITINAYGSERKDVFIVTGSEDPKGIPAWVWALVIAFIGFALFYFTLFWDPATA